MSFRPTRRYEFEVLFAYFACKDDLLFDKFPLRMRFSPPLKANDPEAQVPRLETKIHLILQDHSGTQYFRYFASFDDV